MKKILTASTNQKVIDTVQYACKLYNSYFAAEFLSDTNEVIHYIDYELPEIKVLDFSSADVNCDTIIDAINKDTWLHYGGVIAVCRDQNQVCELEERKDLNMLTIQTVRSFSEHFTRVLRILWQNQQFLFNRGMRDVVGGQESGTFICGNDPLDMRFYSNFLVSYLYNTNRISGDDRFNLQMTFSELLTNAVEHGNLGISYQEKSDFLLTGGDMIDFIQKKARNPEIANRKVHITYSIEKTISRFTIKDDGDGFDWRKMLEAKTDDNEMHGRGISMSRQLVQTLTYNEKGNEVSFTIQNLKNQTSSIPEIMQPFQSITYKDKQVVCREGEMSNDLFFIISGRFAVYVNNKLTTVLTPNDLFIGEMAFLLNDRRTATILAVGECKVIKLQKADFLVLIRKNPHYGIFLSKMLAQRLVRQTKATIEAKNELKKIREEN